MDATPDLNRLAPVENLAIDVISYAHGSVTPTLTNLYTKGKDSFLKVSKIQIFIQDSDNAILDLTNDKYLSYTWDTFLIIYH